MLFYTFDSPKAEQNTKTEKIYSKKLAIFLKKAISFLE